jgi:hypothetical protein
LICRNASEIWISIEMLYRLGRFCEFLRITYIYKLLGLSQGFGGGAPNKLEIKCWRPAEGTDRKLMIIMMLDYLLSQHISNMMAPILT